MKQNKIKIYRKFSDFYTAQDITEPKSPELNLNIEYFNAKGEITNPKAPCVAVTVDPDYIKDAGKRLPVRKFLVKSDILKLREITRTKFFFYTNRLRVMEKAQEQEYQTKIYNNMKNFYKLSFDRLATIERSAFTDLRKTYDRLQSLQGSKLPDDLKLVELEHQKAYMEANEIYRRFRYLLKLVDYFDNISKDGENIVKLNELLNGKYSGFLDSIPESHDIEDITKFQRLMDDLIGPYLAKQTYLDADLWKKGYENIRRKMFNYNRHLSRVALLNHIVAVINEKYMKSHSLLVQKKLFLKDPIFQQNRSAELKVNTVALFDEWQEKHTNDSLVIKIEGVVPVLLSKLQLSSEEDDEHNKDDSISDKVGAVQNRLLFLLNELDTLQPEVRCDLETTIRCEMEKERNLAKQALVKQTRFNNLVNHYKNHYAKKGVVSQYTTNIKRSRGKIYPLKKNTNQDAKK